VATGDTLHVFVVHAPSRAGGEAFTRPLRVRVAERIRNSVDSIRRHSPQARILIAGDFNDYTRDKSIQLMTSHGLTDVSDGATGRNGARGTYRYHGEWGSLDHILCDTRTAAQCTDCHINDAPFLMEEDKKYGGMKPRRTYLGPRYLGGFSDHLPLVATFAF
jgi:endonuclease/exonuclease/phosphatase family metal-dependent hydrolase